MKRRYLFFALVMAGLLLLSACGTGNTSDPQNPDGEKELADTLTVVYKVEPPTLDSTQIASLSASTTNRLIFDKLLDMDEEGNLVPAIATEWEQVDDLTIRFTIRDDVYFHNGDKMTTDDVVYTLQRLTWMKATRTAMEPVIDVENTKAISENEVELKLKMPYAPIFSTLTSGSGNIVCKRAVEEMGDEAYARAPVGTGPMVFSEWISGDSIILNRNENYWGDPVAYKTFVGRTITEAATRAIEVETGGVDVSLDILSADMERIENSDKAHIVTADGVRSIYLGFNMNLAPVDDVRVRQAFAYALDLEQIIAGTYEGDTAVPATSPVPRSVKWHVDVDKYSYDPEKAKELLADAGYEDGLDIEVWVAKDDALVSIAQIAQYMWAQAGINVEIVINETNAVQTAGAAGEIPVWLYNQTYSPFDPDGGLKIFRMGEISIVNSTDQVMQDMLDEGRYTYDEAAREEIYRQIQEYTMEKCYVFPLVNTKVIYGVGNNVENFPADVSSDPDLRNVVVYKK